MRNATKAGVAGVLAALTLAGAALADTQPRVRISTREPLQLTGSGFVAGEKVAVTVEYRDEMYLRKVFATPSGTFTARFAELRVGRCGEDLEIRATGFRGSRFHVTIHQLACSSR